MSMRFYTELFMCNEHALFVEHTIMTKIHLIAYIIQHY